MLNPDFDALVPDRRPAGGLGARAAWSDPQGTAADLTDETSRRRRLARSTTAGAA